MNEDLLDLKGRSFDWQLSSRHGKPARPSAANISETRVSCAANLLPPWLRYVFVGEGSGFQPSEAGMKCKVAWRLRKARPSRKAAVAL
jgi:hypothetical protein